MLILLLAIIAALAYVITFAYCLPVEASIYAFIVTTFLFPNWGTSYFGVGELPAFFFVELVAGLTILLAMVRQPVRRRIAPADRTEWMIAGLFAFTIAFHYLVYWPLKYLGYYPSTEASVAITIVYFVKTCVQLIFLYGCVMFIRTIAQMERACWLFVFCGIELFLEWISFNVLHIVPQIGQFAFDERGRFKSLAENDPLAVGVFSSVAALCALYFAAAKKRTTLLLAVPVLLVPAMGIHQRTFVLCAALAVTFFVWKVARGRRRAVAVCGCGIAMGALLWTGPDLEADLASWYEGTWRDAGPRSVGVDPFSTDQLASRRGLQARGLDVFLTLFPFGTGEFLARYYLSCEAIPPIFEPAGTLAAFTYLQAVTGRKVTELHSGYLEHVVSYGLAGMISLAAFVGIIIRNYYSYRSTGRRPAVYALTYAVLIFFCVLHLFYSYPKIYVVYLLFFHNTFLLLQPTDVRRASRERACGTTGCS